MDHYCRFCKEPWENDTFHEEVEERRRLLLAMPATHPNDPLWRERMLAGLSYKIVAQEFRRYGCGALVGFSTGVLPIHELNGRLHLRPCDLGDGQAADETISTIYEFLGDDMDGAASMLEDMGSLGFR